MGERGKEDSPYWTSQEAECRNWFWQEARSSRSERDSAMEPNASPFEQSEKLNLNLNPKTNDEEELCKL